MLPLTPTKLGRYEIVDEIGKGAMGVVFLARDPLIGRLVALKTFRIGYSVRDAELEQFRVRFIREAQSAGILSHPNIVTIHDVVEQSDDGLAFIAMEYVRGTNLKTLLQGDQPLTLPFVVEVISQVAEALDYAHAHRVIHRDVKPANILITADNRVKITDFGIARLDTSNLTQEGQLLGTPNYMAPEQIQGKEVDHRADLFALGVVLYEMLTRHKPFQGENLTVVSHRIVYDHFTPPRDFVRELPPGLEPVLARALEKDPNRRYQKARDMITDLRRVSASLLGANGANDDLNETQSISVMPAPSLVQPPPIPGSIPRSTSGSAPAPVGTIGTDHGTIHGTMATPHSGSFSMTPPPPTGSTPPFPTPTGGSVATHVSRPKRQAPRVSPRRVALAGGGTALLMLILAGVLFGWLQWATPSAGRSLEQDRQQRQLVELLRTGNRLLRAGDPATAARFFQTAENIAPADKKESMRKLRLAANEQAKKFGELVGLQKQVVEHLVKAQQAIEDRRYEEAITVANAALALDPSSPEASMILASAQTAQARLKERAQPAQRNPRVKRREEIAATTAAPVPEPSAPAAAEESVPQIAALRISFESERDGVANVRVHIDGRSVMSQNVGGKGRPWRRGSNGGSAARTVEVKSGDAQIQVWVTPPGETAQLTTLAGSFAGASSRNLIIRLPKSGDPSVNLY
jgi:serine/threonine protein kinase